VQWVIVVLLAIIAVGVWAIWDEVCAIHRATHLMRNEIVQTLRLPLSAEKPATEDPPLRLERRERGTNS